MRLLFARAGIPHCPICGREVVKQSAQEIVDRVETLPDGTRVLILAPAGARPQRHLPGGLRGDPQGRLRPRPRGWDGVLSWTMTSSWTATSSTPSKRWWTVWSSANNGDKEERKAALTRLTDSVETALKFGEGYVIVLRSCVEPKGSDDLTSPSTWPAPSTASALPEIEPRTFSFNTPHGRLPRLPGSWLQAGNRPGPHHPGPGPLPERGRDRQHGVERTQGGGRLLLAEARSRGPRTITSTSISLSGS